MANVNAPKGLVPKQRLGGGMTHKARPYRKEASVILGIGDPVVLTGEGSVAGTNGALKDGEALVTRASTSSSTTGVVVGLIHDFVNSDAGKAFKSTHMAAADKGTVLVIDDPHAIFEIQEDSDSGAIAKTAVGEFCDFIIADADTARGTSKVMLDSSNAATGDNLRLLNLTDKVGNEIGNYAIWDVMINEHTYNAVGTPI
jgi:hypothetical protein